MSAYDSLITTTPNSSGDFIQIHVVRKQANPGGLGSRQLKDELFRDEQAPLRMDDDGCPNGREQLDSRQDFLERERSCSTYVGF
jgi:hypothetical protein